MGRVSVMEVKVIRWAASLSFSVRFIGDGSEGRSRLKFLSQACRDVRFIGDGSEGEVKIKDTLDDGRVSVCDLSVMEVKDAGITRMEVKV